MSESAPYAEEARERWGDTEAYRESQRRTSGYSPQDWERLKAESADIEGRFAAALAAGEPADGDVAVGLAEEHRLHITRWFYDCTRPIHQGLADMYVADERFREHYEELRPGLAQYIHDAIAAS